MLQGEQISYAYLVRNSGIEIEAPAERVWPYLLRYEESFNRTFEKVEVLSGTPDEVGSISLLTKQQGEWYMPPYYAKIVHIKPGRQIVWKLFPLEGDSFFAFVDFALSEDGGVTTFTSNVYAEFRLPLTTDANRSATEAKMAQDYERLEDHIFPILKSLAEGGA